MQVRRFSPDLKTTVPGGHVGLHAVPIHLDRSLPAARDTDALAARMNGLPILLDRPVVVVALYLDPHGHMEEHSADQPVLMLVTGGRGFVRIGGPSGETRPVTPGDAVLWPAGLDHTIWTEDEPLQVILVDGPPERGAAPTE